MIYLRNKKGIIFTIDSMIAALMVFTIVSAIFIFMANSPRDNSQDILLEKIILDSLIILEFNGDFKESIEDSSNSSLNLFLNSMEKNICSKISLFDSESSLLISSSKSDCNFDENNLKIARRTFIVGKEVYYAEMEGSSNNG